MMRAQKGISAEAHPSPSPMRWVCGRIPAFLSPRGEGLGDVYKRQVGQRFVTLLDAHPLFTPVVLAASSRSAGKPYAQAVGEKWAMTVPIPDYAKNMTVLDAENDAAKIAAAVDFIFCAVNMKKEEIKSLEEKYAKL